MELSGKKVLVTGGAGFIGSHLVEALLEKGAIVRVFLKYDSTGSLEELEKLPPEKLSKIEIFKGNIQDIESTKEAVKGMDVIFHLAALISIPYSYENPREFMDVNIMGTFNILESARNSGIEKIVVTSTSEVYGTAIYSPIDEKHPLQAQSPYSASKIAAEKIAESFYKTYGLPVAIIRPFNTYGPRQSTRAIIPTIISQALTKDKIKLGSLSPRRDFNYVKDTVNGFIRIAECDASIGEVINIGSGESVSIGEVKDLIGQIINKELVVETDESRTRPQNSEVMLLKCDNSKAKRLLNWQPSYSLREGLLEVINYMKENIKDYNPEKYHI
jgi:dTDP-glucose 4,6-dehydratase